MAHSQQLNFSNAANERRRCTHHPISMVGTLKLDAIHTLPCELRDFCLGGLFLTIGDAESRQSLLQKYRQQQVEIQVHVAAQEAVHTLLARVIHVAETGLGVAFEEISIPTLKALFWQSTVGARQPVLPSPAGQNDTSERAQLKQSFSSTVAQFLHQLLDAFFPAAEQSLFDLPVESTHSSEQLSILDSVTELRINRRLIEVGFCHALQGQLDQFLDPDQQQGYSPNEDASLALGERQNLEDWIQVSEIIVESESVYGNQLVELAQKMSNLAHFTIDSQYNPIAPGSICETFIEIVEAAGIAPAAKSTVLMVFGTILQQQLEVFYQKLISLLAPLPAIKFYNDSNCQAIYGKSIGITAEHSAELLSLLKSGLPIESFENLRKNLDISELTLAKILQLQPAELAERKVRGTFHGDESERLYRIARLYDLGQELFMDQPMLRHWFKTPRLALAGLSPIHYADLEPGAVEVEDLIGRLQYGVYS